MRVDGNMTRYEAWRGGVQRSYLVKVTFDGDVTMAVRKVLATTENLRRRASRVLEAFKVLEKCETQKVRHYAQ